MRVSKLQIGLCIALFLSMILAIFDDKILHDEKNEQINDQACMTSHLKESHINYDQVIYRDVYPGIDAVFYGNGNNLEYDLCVAPHSDPDKIRMQIDGAKEITLNCRGDLIVHTENDNEMQMQKPIVYQMIDQKKVFIEGEYVLLANNEIGFALGAYDRNQHLIIDPVLSYSTYFGLNSRLAGIDVDELGNVYIVGETNSSSFPITGGAFQTNFVSVSCIYISKLNSTGSSLVYSTYLGGSGGISNLAGNGNAIKVDSDHNAYIVGFTNASDFPVTGGAFQTFRSGPNDAIVTKLNSSGSSLIYSTYLGGSSTENGTGIAVDSFKKAYVVGSTNSSNFPVTPGAFQTTMTAGSTEVFLTKFNFAGSALEYSTFLGGSASDLPSGITLFGENAFLTGLTQSNDFPTTPGAFKTTISGIRDAFVTQFNSSGTGLVCSTYLGGSASDIGQGIAVDSLGNAYVVGQTSSNNFPTTEGAFQTAYGTGIADAFVTKLNPLATDLIYSTYLGGSLNDVGTTIVLDDANNAYLTGRSSSLNFPTTSDAFQSSRAGTQDAFLSILDSLGSSLLYSTYLGGASGTNSGIAIRLGPLQSIYVAGTTNSTTFPTTSGAFQTQYISPNNDGFITKFDNYPVVTAISPNSGPSSGGTIVTITGTGFINVTSVEFGGVPTVFTVDSGTQITAVSPPGTGVVDVTVTTGGGTSAITINDEFTYIPIPVNSITLVVTPNPAALGQTVTLTVTVNPSSATGTVTFFDGSTPIGTVPLNNGIAVLTASSFSVGQHFLTGVYSGDGSFDPSTSEVVILTIETALPPRRLKAIQRKNEFATQTDIINILTWRSPTAGTTPVEYRIYRNAKLTRLIGVILANENLRFEDHNRRDGETYTYWIVSVDAFGNVSEPAFVEIS